MSEQTERVLPGLLLASPPPLPGESPASWVQRVCGAHQYSLDHLCEVSGIRPVAGDWDRPISPEKWSLLMAMAGRGEHACAEAIRQLGSLFKQPLGRRFLLYEKSKPRYRWCIKCWRCDVTPFLRWRWRLASTSHCTVHRTLLKERCSWCGMYLCIDRALLVGASGAADLTICRRCGFSLVDCDDQTGSGNHAVDARGDSSSWSDSEIAEAAIAELQIFLNEISYCSREILSKRGETSSPLGTDGDPVVESNLEDRCLPDSGTYTLRIDHRIFEVNGPPLTLQKVKRRRLGPRTRIQLARALWIIRAEKNAMRLEVCFLMSAAGLLSILEQP